LGRLSVRESLALACGMNARGSTEVIVASIGLSIGVISQDLFTMIVAMAIVTTLAMPPTLRWALARLPLHEEEKARLAREAFEAKGFVSNLERLLVAVDDSANGKLALRLAGLLAGSRGITTTVLHLGRAGAEAVVRNAMARSGSSASQQVHRKVHLTLRSNVLPAESAIPSEMQKGDDLLILGIAKTVTPHGGFHEQISRIAAMFEGPLVVVVARGAHFEHPEGGGLNILVPVRGLATGSRAGARANPARGPPAHGFLCPQHGGIGRRDAHPPSRGINTEGDCRACRLVWAIYPDRVTPQRRARRCHPSAVSPWRLQPHRHGGWSAGRRDAVLWQGSGSGSRKLRSVDPLPLELMRDVHVRQVTRLSPHLVAKISRRRLDELIEKRCNHSDR
jgi:hypothetical protein